MTAIDAADLVARWAPALPWVVGPIALAARLRRPHTLERHSPVPPAQPLRVSVIVPARNEERNVARCLRALLASQWPALEVILVDDHSTDATGAIAREVAAGDARLRVFANPDLPDGWFGKQWACWNGAAAARGEILCFADADTEQAPDLVPRAVAAIAALEADLLSVAGWQELGSFWERLLQPQVFSMLLLRYGGTAGVNTARRAEDVIANGQCLFMRRDAYDAVGGHAAVRDKVAEDLAMAQAVFRAGKRVRLVLGTEQLSTRMYTSLRELVAGWGKNIYAGGIDAVPGGRAGRALFPLLLLLGPLANLWPPIALALALAGVMPTNVAWAALATAITTVWWALTYAWLEEPPWYALLYPLGAAVLFWIILTAIFRGRRVAWKGRTYRSA
ncbi:MAG TPA: glycosyltransferase family A protein [Gemmatimonadaceae bacterium]